MLKRGLAFCTTLVMASVVQAGATITLVPQTSGPYAAGDGILVDVMLANDGGDTDHSLRFIQLDFSNSSPAMLDCTDPLTGCLSPSAVHNPGCPSGVANSGVVRFWSFDGTPLCDGAPGSCGCGHFLEDDIGGTRPNVLSSTYYFTDPINLGENTNAQRVLLGDGTPLKIGTMFVNLPPADGTYTLDVMGTATNPDLGGADVRWGFGTNVNGEALTTWRNGSGLSGGALEICVGAVCGCAPTASLVSADPLDQKSLWRSAKNIIRLQMSGAIADPTAPGEVKIQELLDGGLFGADLSAGFSMTVEPGNILKIRDNAANLAHRTWYAVRVENDCDWDGVSAFEVQYVVQVGDADGNRFVTPVDVGQVNASPVGAVADNSRFDIDGNGFRTAGDVGTANAGQGALPPKPAGH